VAHAESCDLRLAASLQSAVLFSCQSSFAHSTWQPSGQLPRNLLSGTIGVSKDSGGVYLPLGEVGTAHCSQMATRVIRQPKPKQGGSAANLMAT